MTPTGYDQSTDETTATLTVTNTQPDTIYLALVQYDEFDQYGNLITSQQLGGNG